MNNNNKTALVTGGSRGIGLGVAESLLEDGYRVMITGRNRQRLEEAVTKLSEKYGDRIASHVSDVTRLDSEKDTVAAMLDRWGSVDVVIANAGVGHFAPIQELTPQQWNDVIDINLTGVFNTTKASLDALIQSKGYLITIASLAGTNFFKGGAAYNASKFGLVGFTQAVMLDVRHQGVKVTTIMPGSVSTYFNNRTPSEAESWKIQPEDIGQMVLDLLHMHPRTLPSKIEVRPSVPPSK